MSTSVLAPVSAFPVSNSDTFFHIYEGDGGNSVHEMTMGVDASISSDAIWRLRFITPPELPSGTAKIKLIALADAETGAAKVNPKWANVAIESDPSSATLTAEGTNTITWSSGDDDVYKELKIELDADVIEANSFIVMDLTFETTDWTLGVISGWYAFIVWE